MNAQQIAFLEALHALRLRLRANGARRPGHPSRRTGGQTEFHSHRRYEPRDPPRTIDWRVFARTGTLVARGFAAEDNTQLHLVLDGSGSMRIGTPAKYRIATDFVFGVGYLALCAGATVSVWAALGTAANVPAPPPAQAVSAVVRRLFGASRWLELRHALEAMIAGGSVSLPDAIAVLDERIPRSGEIVLVSDFISPSLGVGTLDRLGRNRRVTLVQVLAEEDRRPDLGAAALLQDSETLEVRAADLDSETLRRYQARLRQCEFVPRQWCHDNQQRWLSHDPLRPVIELVQSFVTAAAEPLALRHPPSNRAV